MDGQMDEGQQHQGSFTSPPPLAHFSPIREGEGRKLHFGGIFFQMPFFLPNVTTYLAREKISKWQLYQQRSQQVDEAKEMVKLFTTS